LDLTFAGHKNILDQKWFNCYTYFLTDANLLLVRMQGKKPIEGYDTSLLHLKDGKAIELE